MKKILMLGGSTQQIPAIESAKKNGFYTVLCDFLTDNPGQYHADKFYCVSTTDKNAILKVAESEMVSGVVAYASDPAAPTAAYVAEKLGLPTNPYDSVEILANKDKYRKFLEENHFYTPKSQGYSSMEEVLKDISTFTLPIMIKPVDSSGSKGVSRLDDLSELAEKFKYALEFSRAKRVIIEELVELSGYQVAGDGFSINWELVFRCLANDHFAANGLNPFVPISASFPCNRPTKIEKKIHEEVQRAFSLLNLKTGAYNFDIRVDQNDNVYLMEIGPRNGGNFIPQVIKYASGIDLTEYTIKAAMGEDCSNLKMSGTQGCWSYYAIHSFKEGILKEIRIEDPVKRNHVVESYFNYNVGDQVPAFTGANCSLGILIMKFDNMKQMLDMMDHSEKWITVIVE